MPGPPKKGDLQNLLREISSLQSSWSDILQRVDLNVRAQFTDLQNALKGRGFAGEKPARPTKKKLEAMLREVEQLAIKADRGRVKDLNRIEKLLKSLNKMLHG